MSATTAAVRTLPSVLTIAGLACGLAGAALWPAPWASLWLLTGLVLDELDGRTARALDAATAQGAALDWHVDIVCAAALVVRLVPSTVGAGMGLGAACLWWAWASTRRLRVSGRAALTAVAVLSAGWGVL